MSKFKYWVELAKVILAYTCVAVTLLSPLCGAWWFGNLIYADSGSRIMGEFAATALSLPALMLGLLLSRLVAWFFASTWGKDYE